MNYGKLMITIVNYGNQAWLAGKLPIYRWFPGFLHLLWLFQQATFDWQREYSPHPILYLQALDPCHCGKGWTSPMTELDLETSRLWSILAGKTMIVIWCMVIDYSHSWIFLNYKRTGSNIHLPVQNPLTGWNTGNWVERLATARPVEKIIYICRDFIVADFRRGCFAVFATAHFFVHVFTYILLFLDLLSDLNIFFLHAFLV